MQSLRLDESVLIGSWIVKNNSVIADEVSKRIENLINNTLKMVGVSDDGWEKLYIDPHDNRYWELTFPNNESHGGGAPKLAVVNIQSVKFKYHIEEI
jgi:hypothetical protein